MNDADYNPFAQEPPEQTEEEAHYELIAATVENFVVDTQNLLATVDEMIEDTIGSRTMMENLREALVAALSEFDPDDDPGYDDPRYPY